MKKSDVADDLPPPACNHQDHTNIDLEDGESLEACARKCRTACRVFNFSRGSRRSCNGTCRMCLHQEFSKVLPNHWPLEFDPRKQRMALYNKIILTSGDNLNLIK